MVTLTPSGGSATSIVGKTPSKSDPIVGNPIGSNIGTIGQPITPPTGIYPINLDPVQVVGLTQMTECDATECREVCYCKYFIPVFGNLVSGVAEANPSYENDFSSFLIDVSIYNANPTNPPTVTWTLEKLDEFCVWNTVATLSNSLYGTRYQLGNGTFVTAGHPSYDGFQLNWGRVMQYQGAGKYRVKVSTTFGTFAGCLVSEPYYVRQFDCHLAHGTVKVENWLTGKIGDPYTDYKFHDLCNLSWYDSIRFKGFFGYHKIPQYIENLVEWGKPKGGLIERISDEAVQQYEFKTNWLPQWIHDRLAIFGLMSDTAFFSDYNKNNSDYTLKRKHMVKAGNYEPEYADKNWVRLSKATILLRRGVQNVIKTNCCDVERPSGSVG